MRHPTPPHPTSPTRDPLPNANPQQHLFRLRLDELRKRAGLSQNQLALAVGVNPAHVHRLLRGQPYDAPKQVSRALCLTFARAFDLDAHDTDQLLWLAGHAPCVNYQAICDELAETLGRLAELSLAARGILAQDSGAASSSLSSSGANGSTGRAR